MTIKPLKVVAAVAAFGVLGAANASSLAISPDFSVANVGDVITFNISADLSDQAANFVAGGDIDVTFGAGLAFVSADVAGDNMPWDNAFTQILDDGSAGRYSVAFAQFNGVGGEVYDILSISFEVLGNAMISVSAPSQAPGATGWLDFGGGTIAFDTVNSEVVVPVPAAVWFMLSGLGALLGFGRKRA